MADGQKEGAQYIKQAKKRKGATGKRIAPGGEEEKPVHFKHTEYHGNTQVITGFKGHQKKRKTSKVVTEEGEREVYLFMSQSGRRLVIKSSLVPTMSVGSRLTR